MTQKRDNGWKGTNVSLGRLRLFIGYKNYWRSPVSMNISIQEVVIYTYFHLVGSFCYLRKF